MLMLFRGIVLDVSDVKCFSPNVNYAQLDFKSGGFMQLVPGDGESVEDLILIFWHNYNLTIKGLAQVY